MELFGTEAMAISLLVVGFSVVFRLLKGFNWFVYELKLAGSVRSSLPPGDLGWPFLGNMLFFLRCFKSDKPDRFINSFVSRFGKTGVYKAFMFGNPTILTTTPETCRQVLMDDLRFKAGWPKATLTLAGRKSFAGISYQEHKRLRRLTGPPVNGPEALATYLGMIDHVFESALEKWSQIDDPIDFLTELRRLTFRVIMHIFLGEEGKDKIEHLERECTALNYGLRAMAINLPGFAYHRALKARKKLVAELEVIVSGRRQRGSKNAGNDNNKDMLERLMEAEDEDGRKLTDEEIIDVLLMYLNAGHESSAHLTMWITLLVQEHPEVFQKLKDEQEKIVKSRPAGQKGLSMQEIKQMHYLDKVRDEGFRWVSFSPFVFREATEDVNVNGFTIPKGWKVAVWLRSIHKGSDVHSDPMKFDPSRWEGVTPKVGTFMPFGAGSRLCPGNELAKLEIGVFLHYFVRGYTVERLNPKSKIMLLPHPRPADNCMARIKKQS